MVIPAFVDDDFCDQLKEFSIRQRHLGDLATRTYQGIYQPDKRFVEFGFLSAADHACLCERIASARGAFLDNDCDIVGFTPSVIYRYPVGVGFTLHHDEITPVERENAERTGAPLIGGDITAILQINSPTEYDGGELVFPKYGLNIKAPMGALVLFPATKCYEHMVQPITRGLRYSVVTRLFCN